MEIKINDNEKVREHKSSNTKAKEGLVGFFSKCFNDAVGGTEESKSVVKFENEKDSTKDLIESPYFVNMCNILDIKENDWNKLYKDNGKLNVVKMINDYGNNLTSNELNSFVGSMNKLYEEGMIDTEDYYYALRWIALKVQQFAIKLQIEDEQNSIVNYKVDANSTISSSEAEKDRDRNLEVGHNTIEVREMTNKMKAKNTRKKGNVNHNPQAESSRAVFGDPKAKEYDPTDFKV